MWEYICECILHKPGIQEILDAIKAETVCTNAQCFQTEADAFQLTPVPTPPDSSFFEFMTCVFALLVLARLALARQALAQRPLLHEETSKPRRYSL